MKILVILMIFYFSNIVFAQRNPFNFGLQCLKANEKLLSLSSPSAQEKKLIKEQVITKQSLKNNVKKDQWKILHSFDDVVVLQDNQGNIREIALSSEEER
ncbi:MAG: hypothetical protein WDZ41_03020 [Candidatus Babeliales bacterium]